MGNLQSSTNKDNDLANKLAELKKFGEILQQMLLSSTDEFTYERIVRELRIVIEDVLQKFDCESFEQLLETGTMKEFVEYEYSLDAGQFIYRGKLTANMSNIRKEILESEMNKRIKNIDLKIDRNIKQTHSNLNKLWNNFERIQANRDAQHAQEISNMNTKLEMERNERIKMVNELEEVKRQLEQFLLLHQRPNYEFIMVHKPMGTGFYRHCLKLTSKGLNVQHQYNDDIGRFKII